MKKVISWSVCMIVAIGVLVCMAFPALTSKTTQLSMVSFLKDPVAIQTRALSYSYNMIRFSQLILIIAAVLLFLIGLLGIFQHYHILKVKISSTLFSLILGVIMFVAAIISLIGCLLYIQYDKNGTTLKIGVSTILTLGLVIILLIVQLFNLKKTKKIIQN